MDYIPLIIVRDPIYCFEGITTEEELDFIISLSTDQWRELFVSHFEENFDEFTQNYKDMILKNFSDEFIEFKKSVSK